MNLMEKWNIHTDSFQSLEKWQEQPIIQSFNHSFNHSTVPLTEGNPYGYSIISIKTLCPLK